MENPPFQYFTKPFDHQRCVFDSTWHYQYFAYFWEMGLGKSKIIIDTMQRLYLEGKIRAVIIVAEKGYYLNWPLEQIPLHWPDYLSINISIYSSYRTVKAKQQLEKGLKPVDGLQVLIINVESLSGGSHKRGVQYCHDFIDAHGSTMMVVDESTTIKNIKASRTRQAINIGRRCTYRRILTGTPITQSPLDLYSQFEFLKHGVLGFNSFTSFRSFYSIMETRNLGPNRSFQQIVGYRELDDLTDRVRPLSSRLLKTECLDLPEKLYTKIYVEPTEGQLRLLGWLKTEAMAFLNGDSVTVENALALLTKALQIASGHVRSDAGDTHRVESNKAETLSLLVQEAPLDVKIIVWGYFREDMQIIMETLKKIDIPAWEISGRIGQDQRVESVSRFRKCSRKCCLVATPRVMGKAMNLTEATLSIYYSNGFNLEHRLQSEDRNHRIGQRNNVMYYDLICSSSPDEKVVQALRNKEVISRNILSTLSSFFEKVD